MKVNKKLVARRFGDNYEQYDRLADIQQEIAEQLASMIISLRQPEDVSRALEIGVGTGFLTRRLVKIYSGAQWYLNDISEHSRDFIEKPAPYPNLHWLL